MEDVHNSSAYSSLANSMTEINERGYPNNNKSQTMNDSGSVDGKDSIDQMRVITDDYHKLLRKATEQIKSLSKEKVELQEQCEKMMSLNEELVKDLAKIIRRETKLKQENEDVIKANAELFDETQRLTDEEEKWVGEKERFESEVQQLRGQIETIEQRVLSKTHDKGLEAEIKRLREENARYRGECRTLSEDNAKLEQKLRSTSKQLSAAEADRSHLMQRKEVVSGENMQLMIDAEEQAKYYQKRTLSLQDQLQRVQGRCRELEQDNAKLKHEAKAKVSPNHHVVSAVVEPQQQQSRTPKMEELIEKNKNLSEWREQLIAKNKALTEENVKLKNKCQNLEDLLNEEETDISDVLELIKKMQGSPQGAATKVGPISKFRDLHF